MKLHPTPLIPASRTHTHAHTYTYTLTTQASNLRLFASVQATEDLQVPFVHSTTTYIHNTARET